MKFCDKLIILRKERGYSQEQLSGYLGVSRQSVSKWEADASMPELSKLLQIADLFEVSMDYLVRDEIEERERRTEGSFDSASRERIQEQLDEITDYVRKNPFSYGFRYEYRSKREIAGLPLVHICLGGGRYLKGFHPAKGIFAIGDVAVGIVAFGGFSVGVVGIGGIGIGLLALGGLGIGAMAFGGVALGICAIGAAAIGYYSGGVAAVGKLAVGVAACGETVIAKDGMGEHVLLYKDLASAKQAADFIRASRPHLLEPLVRLFSILAAHIE